MFGCLSIFFSLSILILKSHFQDLLISYANDPSFSHFEHKPLQNEKCHLSSHLFWSMLEIFTNVRPSLLFKCKFSPMKMALCSHRIYSPLIHFLPLTFDQWVGRQCTYVIRCNIRLLACSLARSLTRSFTRTHSPIMQYHNSKNLTTHESSTIDESMTMCACVQEWANATSRPLRRSIHARIHTHTHTLISIALYPM